METEQPAPSMLAAAKLPDANLPIEPTSSPRSIGSNSADKADVSLSFSSDTSDQSILRHPKGKRKRTAATDKSILESSYQADPKPDKTARLAIVSQVSLSEKEVQIWFQNRRQNDRRKSRPLSPQEIAALRYGGMHALSSDPPPPFSFATLSQNSSFSSDGHDVSSPPHYQTFTSMTNLLPSKTPVTSPGSASSAESTTPESAAELHQRARENAPGWNHQSNSAPAAIQTPGAHLLPKSISSIGYLANRWNTLGSYTAPPSPTMANAPANSHKCQEERTSLESTVQPSYSAPILPPLQREHVTSQQIKHRPFRLSLSLEGKAEFVSVQSPSPPRRLPSPKPTFLADRRVAYDGSIGSENLPTCLPAIRRSGLSRSYSALPSLGITLPSLPSLTGSLAITLAPTPVSQPMSHPPRLLRGRSRDVHAWESVCDADSRVDDELSAHAEQEASGSAIAAISLLRSTSTLSSASNASSSSVLQPNNHKRNTSSRSARPGPGMKRNKLARALSSVARMQNVSNPRERWQPEENSKDKSLVDTDKKKKLRLSTLLSGNDSDKENWSPDGDDRERTSTNQSSNNARRPLPSSRNAAQRSLLGSDGNKFKKSAQLSATRGGKAATFDGLEIYEDPVPCNPTRKSDQPSRVAAVSAINDVERFMHGAQVSPSKKGDMDCIAGLLSLSQGNWR